MRPRRGTAFLLGAGLVLGLLSLVLGPTTPARAAGCRAPQVAVVVDFEHWGGSTDRGCADGGGLTGVGALEAAGFAVTGTARYGLAFVCRIDDYPTPSHDRCVNTPPASAYWSYWHADPGQTSWTYASVGASQYHPEPGSADAWTFGGTDTGGGGGEPSFSPSDVMPAPTAAASPTTSSPPTSRRSPTAPHTSRPRPTAHSSRSGRSASPSPGTADGPGRTTRPTSAGAGATRSTGRSLNPQSPGAPAAGGSTATSGGVDAAGPTIVDNSAGRSASAGRSGSPWGSVAGFTVVGLLLAATGALVARRRRPR